ncbi:MAG: SAM-dependent chlorinase/fluorinase [Polyangiales bacterium]
MARCITLTTDFGTRDPYVAEVKGVLLSDGPKGLQLVDLSHDLPPFDVHAAALFVRAALPRFPTGTIHLAVVDPGVGSQRRALIVSLRGMTLVGPDNCLFSYLFDGSEQVHAIDPARLGAKHISSTFHGRDLFAPVAARLAQGEPPDTFGPRIDSYQHMAFPMVEIRGDALYGRVIHVDRYGNLITNVSDTTLRGFLGDDPRGATISLGEHAAPLLDHYAQARTGQLLALIGSSGLVELAAREASAASMLGAEVGRVVKVHRAP